LGSPLALRPTERDVVCRSVLRANHVDDATSTAGAELDSTWGKCEESVVLTAADIVTWVEVRTALTHDDLARVNELATEALHAETLSI
jgi:hypothetical protein